MLDHLLNVYFQMAKDAGLRAAGHLKRQAKPLRPVKAGDEENLEFLQKVVMAFPTDTTACTCVWVTIANGGKEEDITIWLLHGEKCFLVQAPDDSSVRFEDPTKLLNFLRNKFSISETTIRAALIQASEGTSELVKTL